MVIVQSPEIHIIKCHANLITQEVNFPSWYQWLKISTSISLERNLFKLSYWLDSLDLFFKGHQFECHDSQGYWKLTWLLILGHWGISRSARKLTPILTVKKKALYLKIFWKFNFSVARPIDSDLFERDRTNKVFESEKW